jgi:hypothetical protein
MELEKCKCGQLGVWCYMPGSMDWPYFCDDCVPRSCICNHYSVTEVDKPTGVEGVDWQWVDVEKTLYCSIDEKGRQQPCCEFSYEEAGYEII